MLQPRRARRQRRRPRRARRRRAALACGAPAGQAFLEGHAYAFAWFGGVFAGVRYANLTSAVKQVLKGRRRVESDRFVALRSHYLFESVFTTLPAVGSIGRLNALLREACEQDLGRRIAGRAVTVAEALAVAGEAVCVMPEPDAVGPPHVCLTIGVTDGAACLQRDPAHGPTACMGS